MRPKYNWVRLLSVVTTLVFAGAWASDVVAATISGVVVNNLSDADSTSVNTPAGKTGSTTREFRSLIDNVSPVTVSGVQAEFSTHMIWMAGLEVDPDGPVVANILQHRAAMEILFTVEDPENNGYTLSFDAVQRGYVTAI